LERSWLKNSRDQNSRVRRNRRHSKKELQASWLNLKLATRASEIAECENPGSARYQCNNAEHRWNGVNAGVSGVHQGGPSPILREYGLEICLLSNGERKLGPPVDLTFSDVRRKNRLSLLSRSSTGGQQTVKVPTAHAEVEDASASLAPKPYTLKRLSSEIGRSSRNVSWGYRDWTCRKI